MTNPDKTEYLLWLDLETTGLDEHAGDQIIEVGCILTDHRLSSLGQFSTVVLPSDGALRQMMKNEIVVAMHEGNGLLEELSDYEHLPRITEVEESLLDWLDGLISTAKITLAGSGVAQFDMRFVRQWMPRLASRLNYYTIDVGVLRRAHEMFVGTDVSAANEGKPHRALDDVRCHLDEARAYRALWSATQLGTPSRDAARADRLVDLVEDIFETEEHTMGSTFDADRYRHSLDELR